MRDENYKKVLLWITFLLFIPVSAVADGGHNHKDSEHNEAEHTHERAREGYVKLTDEGIKNAKINVREAGPATISIQLRVNGRISPVSSNVAHIAARFSGIIREVRKDVGERVLPGDVLAIVESNQNLQKFEVRALQGGVITDRHATIGESIREDETLFVVMELSQLWADFTVFQRDVTRIEIGDKIDIFASGRTEPFKSHISFISPIVEENTQSRTVRAVINNPDNTLAPGAFVSGKIGIEDYQVPVAVAYEGIQTIKERAVLFIEDESGYEKREILVGRSDGTHTEILSGIKSGERYVATNSFTLKAELGKSEAEHQH